MNCNRFESLLDDYVDELLTAEARSEVERHLDACRSCRASLEELRALLRDTRALRRGVAPERDLLPGIRDRIGREARRSRGSSWQRWVAVAASLIVLTLAVWFGLRSLEPEPMSAEVPPGAGSALLAAEINMVEFEAAEMEYEEAAARLLEIVEARGNELSPETRAVIEENLRIIDEAIDQVREALAAEPDDTRNGHILNALYRQKIEFLWRVSRLSS